MDILFGRVQEDSNFIFKKNFFDNRKNEFDTILVSFLFSIFPLFPSFIFFLSTLTSGEMGDRTLLPPSRLIHRYSSSSLSVVLETGQERRSSRFVFGVVSWDLWSTTTVGSTYFTVNQDQLVIPLSLYKGTYQFPFRFNPSGWQFYYQEDSGTEGSVQCEGVVVNRHLPRRSKTNS